jgi:quinol monooxygenase YgiN
MLHIVIYFEVADSEAARAAPLLTAHVAQLKAHRHARDAAAFVETGQSNRFVVTEQWANAEAQKSWAEAAAHSPCGAVEIAPPDIRMHHAWNISDAASSPRDAVHVFTHVDVPPPHLAALEEIFRPFVEDSRKEEGALRFDAIQSSSRPNHFTLIESWSSEPDRRKHATAAHTRAFRAGLNPMLGALYDQRIYSRIA